MLGKKIGQDRLKFCNHCQSAVVCQAE